MSHTNILCCRSLGSLLRGIGNFISRSSEASGVQRFVFRRWPTACWLRLQPSKSGHFPRFSSSGIYSWLERHSYDCGSHFFITNRLQCNVRARWWGLLYMCELPHSDCESNENCCCSRLDDDNGIDICGQRSSISWLAVSLSFRENLFFGGEVLFWGKIWKIFIKWNFGQPIFL